LAPNALLNEGFPADPIPVYPNIWPASKTWTDAPRIEAAFRFLFHRKPLKKGAAEPKPSGEAAAKPAEKPPHRHEYELVVCHGNVIRRKPYP